MALNVVQQFFFKLFTVIVTVIYSIGGGITPPAGEPIQAKNPDKVKMVFATVADTQVSNYLFDRYAAFQESCIDLRNAEVKFDAIVGIGDIAENGLAEEYKLVYDELKDIDTRFIMATGNHDIRLRAYKQSVSRFSKFTNALNGDNDMTKISYSERVNGYKFIVLGSDKMVMEEAYLSPAQLEWLDAELAECKGEPVFVICHQPLKLTHNLPTTWGNGKNKDAGSVGPQNDELKAFLAKHANDSTVFFINGHLHAGFSEYSYQEIEGFHSFNVPALSIENKDGDINGSGLTYIVEVYDNKVIFRARNCRTGEWLPEWDTVIAL